MDATDNRSLGPARIVALALIALAVGRSPTSASHPAPTRSRCPPARTPAS